jgi:hypothetical protein
MERSVTSALPDKPTLNSGCAANKGMQNEENDLFNRGYPRRLNGGACSRHARAAARLPLRCHAVVQAVRASRNGHNQMYGKQHLQAQPSLPGAVSLKPPRRRTHRAGWLNLA